jgi:hypothetical protein
MAHPPDAAFSSIREGRPLERRTYEHIDGCVACRRSLAASGLSLPPRPARRRVLGTRALVLGAAALLFAAVTIAPVRSLALGFVEIFEPRSIAFVPMTSAEFSQMQNLPDFSELGNAEQLTASREAVASDVRSASAVAGFRVREPELPNGMRASQFQISSPGLGQLTFSEAKARAWAAEHSVALRPMPPGMDGAIVRIAFGSIVTALYRNAGDERQNAAGYRAGAPNTYRRPGIGFARRPVVYRGGMHANWGRVDLGPLDGVAVVQMPVPQVGSTGVSMQTIEAYLLSQPGMPPKLVSAFAALRDPMTTLPIPIPIEASYSQPVFVDGVWGMSIGDETGLGAILVWERDGYAYGVFGTRKASDLLAIANTLH